MKLKKSKSKKKSSKSDSKKLNEKDALSEVDKTFYELQIADLNRKLNRLTTLSIHLEQQNENLHCTNEKLDNDRADVIAFLKKACEKQSDEIADIVGRLEALKVTRDAETEEFLARLQTKDDEFNTMQTNLNSEIKLLEGKLNSLEEFRLQRDELMKKFEEQALVQQQQLKEHEEIVYNIERKFIVDKDMLVRHMEQKLVQVSQDFHNATDMRIAESTQRLIRENIAVNNENIQLVHEQKTLYKTNEEVNAKCKHLRIEMAVAKDEAKQSLFKCNVQKDLIKELTEKYNQIKVEVQNCDALNVKIKQQRDEIDKRKEELKELKDNVKTLESNLKDCRAQRKLLLGLLANGNEKSAFLTKTLFEAIFNIRHMVRLRKGVAIEQIDEERRIEEDEVMDHKDSILNELYNMFLCAREAEKECKDLETWVQFYTAGCVGFMPKMKSRVFKERHVETQIGVSFEEFLKMVSSDSENATVASDFSDI